MAISGNWVFCSSTKKLNPQLNDRELKEIDHELNKVIKKSFKENSTLKKFGWNNDAAELLDRWTQATGKNLELHQPTRSDIEMFRLYMKDWTKSLDKGYETAFHSWKILPAKLRKLPGGERIYRKLQHVMSYERRHTENSQVAIKKIQQHLKTLAGRRYFNVDTEKIAKLEALLMSQSNREQQIEIYNQLQKELGDKSNIRKREAAGDLLYGLVDVLEGADVQSLRKSSPDGKSIPWTAAEKSFAKKIQNVWINQRKDLAMVAINALRLERDFAKRLDLRENHARGLVKHLDTIENKIKELEFQIKSPEESKDKRYDINDIEHVKIVGEGKQLRKDYMPHNVLTILKHLDVFHNWMEAEKPNFNMTASEKFKDIVLTSDRSFIDRLKSRGEVAEEYYSRNPLFFISQYAHDITRYNYKRSIETVLADSFDSLIKTSQFAETRGSAEKQEVLNFVDEAISTLNNIAEQSLVSNNLGNSRADKLSRFATSLGFIRTMAYNVRSPMRNYFQKYFEHMDMGAKAPKIARSYISGNKEIETAMTDAAERHGLFWKKSDSFIENFTSNYHTAAATKGTKEATMLPPGMAEINGKVFIVNETLFDKTLRVVDKIADIGSYGHRAVEDLIRAHSFTTAYGLAHKNLSELPSWFRNQEMGSKDPSPDVIKKWIDKSAGYEAYNKVVDIHYDYSMLQKADVIKGPVGSVIGQFKHYRFSNIDMQWNWIKAGLRRVKTGGLGEYEAIRLYRLGTAYSMISGFGAAFGIGLNNLFQNDTYEWLRNYFTYFTADRSTKKGQEKAKKAMYSMGELSELGPAFGMGFELLSIFNKVTIDHSHRLAILGITNDISPVESVNDMDRNYRLARLANIQLARSWYHTKESFLNKNYYKAFLTETGLYASAAQQETSDRFMKLLRKVTKTKTYETRSERREREKVIERYAPGYAAAIKSIDTYLRA